MREGKTKTETDRRESTRAREGETDGERGKGERRIAEQIAAGGIQMIGRTIEP